MSNDSEWRNVRRLLEELEDPFVMFPAQSVARSLNAVILDTEVAFNDRMGPNGVARKFWDVPAELIHAEIGLLIGNAFVLGQVAISQTVGIFEKLRQYSSNVDALPKRKDAILEFEADVSSRSRLSEIVVIETAANYFKHHHEWPKDWELDAKNVQAKTIRHAKVIGMRSGDLTDNLYCALRDLDIWSTDITEIAEKVQLWRERLVLRLSSDPGIANAGKLVK
jgi:hypothetical protein